MTVRGSSGRRPAGALRVGLFGLFGSGNIGNDGSLEAMLGYLRTAHPGAVVNVLCPGPKRVRAGYGVEGTAMRWYTKYADQTSGPTAIGLKALGKGLDVFRTAAWVRRQDAVIVPGTGILETTLPLRPWQTPYSLFLVCAAGKAFGTKVALVSVGSNVTSKRVTRRILASAARLAFYRSYRDQQSWDAMRLAGVNVTRDPVYPDLAFSLPDPAVEPGAEPTVGVGLMDFYGGNDDRQRANELHDSYLANMKVFVRWLVDGGRRVRLFTGDDVDDLAVQEILADLRATRSDLDPERVVAVPTPSLSDMMHRMAAVDIVVATRYHNVLCALKLGKPTVSVGYAAKNAALMTQMGLSGFCQSADSVDAETLMEQFTELEKGSAELTQALTEQSAAYGRRLDEQFSVLSTRVLRSRGANGSSQPAVPVREPAQPT